MSDIKNEKVTIKLGNNEYGLRFTLNAIDDIQDYFNITIGEISTVMTDEKNSIKNLRYLITLLINEDIDCRIDEGEKDLKHLDERYIGRQIDTSNMRDMMSTIFKAFTAGTPQGDDDNPNAVSE